jgi:hypothetical protein
MLGLSLDSLICGRSSFADRSPFHFELTAKIYVSHLPQPLLAQLDTGAAWSILAPDIAAKAQISPRFGDPARLSTRFGIKDGYLLRIPFTLVADEGISLDTEGTFFISPDWPPGQNFLGYSGLLDSIRFALDPQSNHFYFGP